MIRSLAIVVVLILTGSAHAGAARRQARFEIQSKRLDIRMVNAQNGVPLKRAEAAIARADAVAAWSPFRGGLLISVFRNVLFPR